MSAEAERKRPENMVDLLIETAKAFANGCVPHKEFQRCRQQVIDAMTTPPAPTQAKTREEWETRIKEISEANSKARDTLKHLCHEKWDGRDGWHWEIPANPEKDTDLIIGKSLNHVSGLCDAIMSLQASETKLQAENQELRAEVERLREDAAKSSKPEKCDFCLGHGGLPSGGGPPCPLCAGTGMRPPNSLSACPFCGENENVSVKESENGELLFWAECGSCRVTTDIETTPDKALAKWNRRATPPGYETVPEGASDYKALYHELVYQVGIKHPDETRHQTALRYLTNAENQQNNTPQQAKEPPNAQGL